MSSTLTVSATATAMASLMPISSTPSMLTQDHNQQQCDHWPIGGELQRWAAYRLGDVVHKGMSASVFRWPDSIGFEYLKKWCALPSNSRVKSNITLRVPG